MAHFAKIILNGQGKYEVDNVEVVADSIATTEQAGIDFLTNLYNIQGSIPFYKQSFTYQQIIDNPDGKRKNPAARGGLYDIDADAFILPKPYKSWTLNETTYRWQPPTPMPDYESGEPGHWWNEEALSWIAYED